MTSIHESLFITGLFLSISSVLVSVFPPVIVRGLKFTTYADPSAQKHLASLVVLFIMRAVPCHESGCVNVED